MNIRIATIQDAEALSTLGRKSFYEKWKETTAADNMERYLQETFSPAVISEELADGSVLYLIAEEESELIGYAKLLYTFPDFDEVEEGVTFSKQNPIEVSRLYVAPHLIGKSIGAKLMEKVFEIARDRSCDLIWLGVWEKNPAVHFYQRYGFIKAGNHKFIFGSQVDTDLVMVKALK